MQQNTANMSCYEITDCWPAVSVDAVETFYTPAAYGLNHAHQSQTEFLKTSKRSRIFANAELIKKTEEQISNGSWCAEMLTAYLCYQKKNT